MQGLIQIQGLTIMQEIIIIQEMKRIQGAIVIGNKKTIF